MKPERMRIKIAEACGYNGIHAGTPIGLWGTKFPTRAITEIPNYPESLDAMAEARKTLSLTEQIDYAWALCMETEPILHCPSKYDLINATPLQHAEAFLRAKGLWEEGE